jgi:lysophospholipase L1-like esterase
MALSARFGLLVGLFLLVGCDQADLETPAPPPAGNEFATYVAIGNSITAGFQSDGINASTQRQSYAVKVAAQLDTEFNSPLLAPPGCRPPLLNPFTGARVGGGTDTTCALRARPLPDVLHNVAVPGAAVIDVLDNLDADANANELTFLLLGGRTQIEAAAAADPTFVSVWIGDNDVLSPALAGDPTRITPVDTFEVRYTALLDRLDDLDVERGVLIAVGDVTLAPNFSEGQTYWTISQQPNRFPPTFTVADNCRPTGPGATTLVPFDYGFGLIGAAAEGTSVTLDCLNDDEVLTAPEAQTIRDAVSDYNSFIEQQARERGWAFVDVNPIIEDLRDSGAIPAFPNTQMPSEAFGPYFSLDGVHPSGLAHDVVANEVIATLNDTYDTDIPRLDVSAQP